MKSWKVELIAERQTLTEVIIQRGIFLGDLLPFVIAMMSFNYILRKCTGVYKFTKCQEKVNYLMNIDDIKIFVKNEKEMETLIQTVRIYSQNIGMEFGIEKCPC